MTRITMQRVTDRDSHLIINNIKYKLLYNSKSQIHNTKLLYKI